MLDIKRECKFCHEKDAEVVKNPEYTYVRCRICGAYSSVFPTARSHGVYLDPANDAIRAWNLGEMRRA